jgi:hypothetical protein
VPSWLAVIILGVIEGVTEFLPISSTGHLLLVENSGWVPRQSDLFNITIQSGAALAVLLAFGGRLRDLLGRLHEAEPRAYLLKLALAFVITGVGGLAIKRLGWALPKEMAPIVWATLIGGVAILGVEWALRARPSVSRVTWAMAVAVDRDRVLVPGRRAHPPRGGRVRDAARAATSHGPADRLGPARAGHPGLRGDRVPRGPVAAPVDPDAQLRPVRVVPGGSRSRPADPARLSRPDWR